MLKDLQTRRTYKIIGDLDHPEKADQTARLRIERILAAAGNAPFHYPCDRIHQSSLASPVPWRVYALGPDQCRALMQKLVDAGDPTKVANMLAAAQTLLQVTWLPDAGYEPTANPEKDQPIFEGTLRHMEHLAAAGAFVQSILLAAEAEGFRTYWSSGGPLRGAQVFDWLEIPKTEMLIGSIFIYGSSLANGEIKPGSMADKRGEVGDWCYWTDIPE